jgi:hypothetical protein
MKTKFSVLAEPIHPGILGVDFASYLLNFKRGDPDDCHGRKEREKNRDDLPALRGQDDF